MDMALQEERSQPEGVTTPTRLFRKPPKSLVDSSLSQLKRKGKISKKAPKKRQLLFEEDGLQDGTPLVYYFHGQILLQGHKQGFGIFCNCCNTEVSPSLFEAHAGKASRKKPYENIFLSNGKSLHEYSSILKPSYQVEKKNDSICRICGEERDEASCAGCHRSFQKGIKIEGRRARIVEKLDRSAAVACVLCRDYDFNKEGFNERTVMICNQCEKEYHVGCLSKHHMAYLEELPRGNWFCTVACERLYYVVKGLVVCGPVKVLDYAMDSVRAKLRNDVTTFDVKWKVFHGKDDFPENRLLLKGAVHIFHDCFNPIIDSITGEDIIRSMAYGLQLDASDFGGVLCAVLTIDSEVVTAGMFRILGHEVAELPIVATSEPNQGRGYFQLFFACFERLLSTLSIEKVVVPAAKYAKSMWIEIFDFKEVTPEQLKEYREKHTAMLVFNGTTLLERSVRKMSEY